MCLILGILLVSQFDQSRESLDRGPQSGVIWSVSNHSTPHGGLLPMFARLDRIEMILSLLSQRDAFEGPTLSHDPLWLELEQLSQEENEWLDRQFTASV